MVRPARILAISGSLRAGSYNSALLRAAVELAPDSMMIDIYDGLGSLPFVNEDLGLAEAPQPVMDLRARVAEADALLIATPEYNYSVPGILKNAIDWLSLPPSTSCLRRKAVATVGASVGNFGTVRAQLALRPVWVATQARAVGKPEVHVARARQRLDELGRLVDQQSPDLLAELLVELQMLAARRRERLIVLEVDGRSVPRSRRKPRPRRRRAAVTAVAEESSVRRVGRAQRNRSLISSPSSAPSWV